MSQFRSHLRLETDALSTWEGRPQDEHDGIINNGRIKQQGVQRINSNYVGAKGMRTFISLVQKGVHSSATTTTTWSLSGSPSSLFQQFDSSASSSFALADATKTTTTILPSGDTFEPILPAASALIAFGSIVVLSALSVWVWANQVVPVSRTNLALSKKRGPVKDYLEELRAAGDLSNFENSTVGANSTSGEQTAMEGNTTQVTSDATPSSKDTRAFERWLFTDWLQKESAKGSKAGRQKEPALPVLKNAKWNSGDNPVLVASALIIGGVLLSAVTERVASGMF